MQRVTVCWYAAFVCPHGQLPASALQVCSMSAMTSGVQVAFSSFDMVSAILSWRPALYRRANAERSSAYSFRCAVYRLIHDKTHVLLLLLCTRALLLLAYEDEAHSERFVLDGGNKSSCAGRGSALVNASHARMIWSTCSKLCRKSAPSNISRRGAFFPIGVCWSNACCMRKIRSLNCTCVSVNKSS